MLIHKTYKFRLKPAEEHFHMLKQHGGNVRFVWNKLLEYSNSQKQLTGKYPSQNDLQKHILTLKTQNEFIKISHSQPLQINAQKLVKTFIRAYSPEIVSERNKRISEAKQEVEEEKRKKKLAKALNYGFPKFKSKNRNEDNIFYPQAFKIRKSRIYFPKLGWLSYIKHREIEGNPLFLTIVQDGNSQYFVSITSEVKIKDKEKVELSKANIVGIDVGLKNFATLSDGTVIQNPRTLKKYLRKLKIANKSLDRKQLVETTEKTFNNKPIKTSSNRRIKQVEKVQRIYRKVRNIRKDFLHNITKNIITKYDGVILENLDIQNMLKESGKSMNRNILDVSWYEFGRILEYKSVWHAKYFLKVDQYFPSTQKCNKCGQLAKLSLEDRVYICSNCGHTEDRDLNASKNIKDEGIKILSKNSITLATKGIKARGSISLEVEKKREKFVVPKIEKSIFV